jgi:hypothetical protein
MKHLALMSAVALTACAIAFMPLCAGHADEEVDPVFGIKMPAGYRDWRLISIAHEAGKLDDLRAVLGNDIAIEAYRAGKSEFPDGAIIARLAWAYTSSEDNNKVFGQPQSFVAGPPKEGSSSWSRTRRNTPRLAAGGLPSSTTANRSPTRQ